MRKILSLWFRFSALTMLLSGILLAQLDSLTQTPSENTFSRNRIILGYVELLSHYPEDENKAFFLNCSYRSSSLNKASKLFKMDFALETGLNFAFQSQFDRKWKSTNIIIPYGKFGPEIYLGKNILFAGSAGLATILAEGPFYAYPVPFAGLNSFYLIDLSRNFSIELECGFHTFLGPDNPPFWGYLNVGISFN